MRWPAVIEPAHTLNVCILIPRRSPCASCDRKGFLCQERTEPSKHHGWPGTSGAASPSRSSLDAISIRSAPEPEFGLREGQIYSGLGVHTYFTSPPANDMQIHNTQLVLAPSAKFGHWRLLPTTQAPTHGLPFPHRQDAPEHGYLCPGAGLPSMDIVSSCE